MLTRHWRGSFGEKSMENEIVVRKYTDLKSFFETKALQNQIILNNNFLDIYDSCKN